MASGTDYRAKAQQFLRMAAETTDPLAATLSRMLAEDYLALAEQYKTHPVGQQQQQIQPREPEDK
jgi:hypothetical protein